MITRAQIRNFRCLLDVDLTFEPLTIMVGPNASGKSAIIAALQRSNSLDPQVNGWRHTAMPDIRVSVDGSDLVPRDSSTFQYVQSLQLDIGELRKPNQVLESKILSSNGNNLTNTFDTLTRAEQDALVKTFTKLVPMYRDVSARPLSTVGLKRLVFQDRWAPSLWYEPHEVSDGTILLFAFLLLQYQSVPVAIVTIEEPERGLHPYLVGELIGVLRGLASGSFGRAPIQVVLATHSAELLEFAHPSEVRFITRRSTDGATQVELAPTGTEDWANAVKEYQGSLGGIWLSGSLGGVPGN